jgi:hypothetical protein
MRDFIFPLFSERRKGYQFDRIECRSDDADDNDNDYDYDGDDAKR